MANKNFTNELNETGSVYNDIETAIGNTPAAEEITEPKKKQPAKKNTKASKTQKTQATQKTRSTRKTQERPTERMNLSLTPSNKEYIEVFAGMYGVDKCRFVNMVLEEHAAQNEHYKEIMKIRGKINK